MTFPSIISKTSNTGLRMVISANTNCTHWKRYVYLLLSAISCLLYSTYFRNPSTLILSSEIMYRYVLWQMRFSVTEHSSTARGGVGVFYFKLMNKTAWQEHLWQISGALVAALCQDHWFGFTIQIVLCSYLPRPNPHHIYLAQMLCGARYAISDCHVINVHVHVYTMSNLITRTSVGYHYNKQALHIGPSTLHTVWYLL